MADTATNATIYNGQRRKVIRCRGVSDGTGETDAIKMDISTFTFNSGNVFTAVPTYTIIDMIDYNMQGYTSLRLEWDRGTDVLIAIIPPGSGTLDFNAVGGMVDTGSGGTGDIVLTTVGHDSGDTYDLTLYVRPKN